MKRVFAWVLALTLLLSPTLTAAAESGEETVDISYRGIRLVVNGSEIVPCDVNGRRVEPFLLGGSTYLPVRAVAGALGLAVDWDDASSTITLTTGAEPHYGSESPSLSLMETQRVTVSYRDIQLVIDGVPITPCDVAGNPVEPFLLGGSAYLPLRAVADALGLEVDWDGSSSTVYLSGQVSSTVEYLLSRRLLQSQQEAEGVFVEEEESFDYDARGNLLLHRHSGPEGSCTTAYRYDERGQLLHSHSSGSQESSLWYLYDDSGNCIRREQRAGEESTVELFRHDAAGRLLYREENRGEHSESWEYRYEKGLLTEEVHRTDGDILSTRVYTYDEAGRCLSDSVYHADGTRSLCQYTYNEAGLLRSVSYRCGRESYTHTYRYDEQGRRISERYVSGDYESRWFYTYDEQGNRIRTAHDESTGVNTELCQSYSAENRLLSSVFTDKLHPENNRREDFRYDDHGNLIWESYADAQGNTRLVSHSIRYDERGNLLRKETLADGLLSILSCEYVPVLKK